MPGWKNFRRIKKINRYLLARDIHKNAFRLSAYPRSVYLMTDPICDLHCRMCSRKYLSGEELKSRIDEKTLIKFANEVFPLTETMRLSVLGEPFLSPLFDLEMELARKYAVMTEIFTNGMRIDIDRIKRYAGHIRALIFSVDSPEQRTYEAIRRGGDFSRIVRNINEIREIFKKIPRGNRPALAINMVLMRCNLEQLSAMVLFSKKSGVDCLSVSKLDVVDGRMEKESIERYGSRVRNALNNAMHVAKKKKLPLFIKSENAINFSGVLLTSLVQKKLGGDDRLTSRILCPFLWERVILDMHGNIVVCCATRERLIAGNIRTNNFASIWNSKLYQEMRKSFLKGENGGRLCRICVKRGYLAPILKNDWHE